MPVHHLTSELSPPIEIQAGDIIQNHSRSVIEIVHTDHAADPARLHLSVTNKETAMNDLIQTSLTRAAALLTEAAASLQDASAEAAAGKIDMARGGSEFALGSTRRALALIEAFHTIQTECGRAD